MQIDNAYYHVNPPESGTIIKQKERPILHQFLRKILFENLNRTTIEKTVKYLRKFNWDDDTFFDYGVKCLIRAFKVKYLNIHCLAEVLAAFWHYQEDVVVCVIDKLFEDIRMGMETNLTRFNQRRVAQINFLGELYAYRLIDTVELFKVSKNNELRFADKMFFQGPYILLSRLLYVTEGKYWNQLKKFRKFRVVLSSGSHETRSTAKKVTASDSAKPGPHIHIFFFHLGVHGHFWLKFGRVLSVYGPLMLLNFVEIGVGGWGLELNFLWFQIEETFWEAKF